MQSHYIGVLFAMAITSTTNKLDSNMENPLSIKYECRNNPECVFENRTITIDITITNTKNYDIGIPLEYLERKGPSCYLIDTITQEKSELGLGLPARSSINKFIKLKPGEHVIIDRDIKKLEIQAFKERMVDLTAVLAISSLIELPDAPMPVKFRSGASIHILGRDTLEAKKLQNQ